MEERVIKAIKSCMKKNATISLGTDIILDLGFDSVDILMLISELEEEFNITIDEQDFKDVQTVRDVLDKLRGNHV